jgi:CBS domain-containing protein
MSPRAAWRLESLGFERVFDYVAGKADWLAAGLPSEGTAAQRPRVGALARLDTPTCGLAERLGDLRDRVTSAGWDECVVVNDERIVLGIVDPRPLASGNADAVVETVMRPGPTTFRASVTVEEVTAHMREHRLKRSLVTTPEGRLIGAVLGVDLGMAERVDPPRRAM